MEINASTKLSVKKKVVTKAGKGKMPGKAGGGAAAKRRGSLAPPLRPAALASEDAIARLKIKSFNDQKNQVEDLFRRALGEQSALNLSTPHAASTTRDRSAAAADVAVMARELGVSFVMKRCGVLPALQRLLFPNGIEEFLAKADENENENQPARLKPSASALSLASMDSGSNLTPPPSCADSLGTDSKRGKNAPPNAREGCLLFIRALCEIVGKKAEHFVVGAFLAAALDECGSSSSAIRAAAEDTATAIINVAHPWSFPSIVCPILLPAIRSNEWRIKSNALEKLEQCATTAPVQVQKFIPRLIPAITNQVWDTKAQVSKAARSTLLAICETNTNADIKPAIPAVVNAISKPADTNKAVSELTGTTFVVPVDASTLAILCPVLARALKEKLAIHKRAACIVISNMSKLVESPSAVAPFGSLLVPELQRVVHNVQFEEIRDEALKALASLTKALGDSYNATAETDAADEMADEQAQIEAEQARIQGERDEQAKRETEIKQKEEEERAKFKEAMDAQRQLDIIAAKEAEAKRKEEEQKREKQKLGTKGSAGKCQGCGLKKCKKSCMFYSG